MKNHGILVHLRHILINFLDFDLILCFWQYVLDPLPPQLLSQKTFFFNFLTWGYLAPSYLDNVNKYTVFFFRLPLSRCEWQWQWQWQWIFNLPFNPLTWKHRFMEPLGMYTVYLYFTVLLYYIHMLYFLFLYYFFCCFSVRPFCSSIPFWNCCTILARLYILK